MAAKSRLDALAGLRFVAAAVVALAHLPAVSHDPELGKIAVRFLSEGLYGLTFFFVLSGFVLAYGYHERLAQPTRVSLKSYYIARVARIWPLHLFTLGLAIVLPISPQPGGAGPLAMVVDWDGGAVTGADYARLLGGSFKVVIRGPAAAGFQKKGPVADLQATFTFTAFE